MKKNYELLYLKVNNKYYMVNKDCIGTYVLLEDSEILYYKNYKLHKKKIFQGCMDPDYLYIYELRSDGFYHYVTNGCIKITYDSAWDGIVTYDPETYIIENDIGFLDGFFTANGSIALFNEYDVIDLKDLDCKKIKFEIITYYNRGFFL